MRHLLSIGLHHDQDVVTARQRAAHISQLLGFDVSEQTRIATAVSEIVRNAFRYARSGVVSFGINEEEDPQRLVIQVSDDGPGITNLDDVLSGRYRSSTGMGLGIVGARRLMDRFTIESAPAGTRVTLEKALSVRQEAVTSPRAKYIAEAVERKRPDSLIEEIQHQNQELLRALDELQRKQQELVRLNRELEDTNRGVVALYAELDEKADHLRRADELKSRFLSNMTHEFRTPVNSIIGLSNLLLEDFRREGREALPEIVYIRQAAEQLSDLVNDLLDLAKVEAGKTVVRPSEFEVGNLFGALRGMLKPLLLNQSVALVFDDASSLPPLYTDEGKLSQILRNLLSNALKFTERGEVRMTASTTDDGSTIVFTVTDTGIGIAEEDQSRIFEEFTQVEHRLQKNVRGTGLGLPLSKKLAELLGGALTVQSDAGIGSTFTVAIPRRYPVPRRAPEIRWTVESGKLPMLIVEDAADAQYLYEKVLRSSVFEIVPVATVGEAEAVLERIEPAFIVLDVVLAEEYAWEFLSRLRRGEKTRTTPVLVVSSAPEREKAFALGADAFLTKPIDRRLFLNTVKELHGRQVTPVRVLAIDDEEIARYLLRQSLPTPMYLLMEARDGEEGLRLAREEQPDIVLLDLFMPGIHGTEVLRRLREDPLTRDIPVIVVTSQALERDERDRLLRDADALFSKADVSRDNLGAAVRAALSRAASSRPEPAAPPFPL